MEQSLYVGNVTGYAIADGFLRLVRIEEGSEEFRAHYGAMDEETRWIYLFLRSCLPCLAAGAMKDWS
jgi:hypothetical protein